MFKKIPLYLQILIGMVVGLLWGVVAVKFELVHFTADWIKPWGTIFINLLKLIAVPLVFVSLIKGISGLNNIGKLSKLGLKTLGLYVLSMLGSIVIGLAVVNMIKPGNTFPEESRVEYLEKFSSNLDEKNQAAAEMKEQSPLQFLVDMVPDNIIFAAGKNSNMLQVIVFAILISIAMIMLPESKVKPFRNVIESLNDIVLKLIDIIMKTAPVGVFALLAGLVVDFSGDTDLFKALGFYFITTVLGLLACIFIFYPIYLKVFIPKLKFFKYLKGIFPAQLVAFTTSSSAATLPVTMKQSTEELGVKEEISNFVLPVGVTINMDGTSCYQAIAAVFIAQVFGMDLTLLEQLAILFTALLAAIGSPGVPGGSIVMLIIVLSSVGIPVEGLALILGLDRPLDMLRTVVNITGDTAVCTVTAKTEKALDTSKVY